MATAKNMLTETKITELRIFDFVAKVEAGIPEAAVHSGELHIHLTAMQANEIGYFFLRVGELLAEGK